MLDGVHARHRGPAWCIPRLIPLVFALCIAAPAGIPAERRTHHAREHFSGAPASPCTRETDPAMRFASSIPPLTGLHLRLRGGAVEKASGRGAAAGKGKKSSAAKGEGGPAGVKSKSKNKSKRKGGKTRWYWPGIYLQRPGVYHGTSVCVTRSDSVGLADPLQLLAEQEKTWEEARHERRRTGPQRRSVRFL